MVQLRDDLLEDVTRLFFEWKRIMLEVASERGNEEYLSEKLLRAEELAAYIDALTGGRFSREIE